MGPCRAPGVDIGTWRTKDARLSVLGQVDVRLFGGEGDEGSMAGDVGPFRARILHFWRNLRHLQG